MDGAVVGRRRHVSHGGTWPCGHGGWRRGPDGQGALIRTVRGEVGVCAAGWWRARWVARHDGVVVYMRMCSSQSGVVAGVVPILAVASSSRFLVDGLLSILLLVSGGWTPI